MRAHIVEIGPNAIRRLCCGVAIPDDIERRRVALESLDDPVALVGTQPMTVESLWRSVLEPLKCGGAERVIVLHPTWWSPSRVDVLAAAATVFGGDVVMKPRSWILRKACQHPAAIVEITDGFVVVSGESVSAESRREEAQSVVDAIARSVLRSAAQAVVVDAPSSVRGAAALAAQIAGDLRDAVGRTVVQVGDIELRTLANGVLSTAEQNPVTAAPHHGRTRRRLAIAALAVCMIISVGARLEHRAQPAHDAVPTTYLVEGHVALDVPARWAVRRVVAGPGSARLQISSPSDPDAALHVTQSRVALEDLGATAEFLRGAIDAAPAGVFVDFNPADRTTGRPVVTYREIRSGHDIRWTVWVDKAVRISIGCQSRPGHEEGVRRECDLAVRSARALI